MALLELIPASLHQLLDRKTPQAGSHLPDGKPPLPKDFAARPREKDMPTLIKDLIHIPEQVHRGDLVLKLVEGVADPEGTLAVYVVTPALQHTFEDAMKLVKSAVLERSSKATYLHGSFGAGKSHFMAVLHMLLTGHEAVRRHPDLQELYARHRSWSDGRRFLVVPFHMMDARSMESAILGQYLEYVGKLHPEAPLPGVFRAEGLLEDARRLRETMGDEGFFAHLNEGRDSDWGTLDAGWDPRSFEEATLAPPGSEARTQLVSALVTTLFTSYARVIHGEAEAYLDLDTGLEVISRHAASLGYDGLVLFLDELILWLASRAADPHFVHVEGQKLAKLVEAQHMDRPIPLVSFVARQRDLSELIGDHVTGAERLTFKDSLAHWGGRFHTLVLEDRNLPLIAEKRLLRPVDEAARLAIDEAFDSTMKEREEVLRILMTDEADRQAFRQLYPFSPALVEALVAVSAVLQRERTALKAMLELLVRQRDTLELGSVLPVGDLFDVVADGEEIYTDVMRVQFQNARNLYHQKLLPLLEETHDLSGEVALAGPTGMDADQDKRIRAFRNDDRLLKTLLLAALVPEVKSLKNLTPNRLAALNLGSFRSRIRGEEGRLVHSKLTTWAGRVGEIRLGGDPANPTVSLQLVGVDTESILQRGREVDNVGNRKTMLRRLLYESTGVREEGLFARHRLVWRGLPREVEVVYANVRELNPEGLRAEGEAWKLFLDYPFDEQTFGPQDDRNRAQEYLDGGLPPTRTLLWLPSFFSGETLRELGDLVALEHVLAGERFDQYANHLKASDRPAARVILENQANALKNRFLRYLLMAYGVAPAEPGVLDEARSLSAEEHFTCLHPDLRPLPPVGADLAEALRRLLGQAVDSQYPGHPTFSEQRDELRVRDAKAMWLEIQSAAGAPDHRVFVENKSIRPVLGDVLGALQVADMGDTYLRLLPEWTVRFERRLDEDKPPTLTVRHLYRWIDDPQPTGLPDWLKDLVVLSFAARSNRSFVLYGRLEEPQPGDLKPEMELVAQALPSEADWLEAHRRALALLGVKTPSDALRPAPVARFADEVRKKAEGLQPPARDLPKTLVELMRRLVETVDDALLADWPRYRTARAATAFLEVLVKEKEPTLLVQALAQADLPASLAVVADSLARAERLNSCIRTGQLSLLEGIAGLEGDRGQTARSLLDRLTGALRAEELEQPLAPRLEEALNRAVKLLVAPPTVAPQPDAVAEPDPPPLPAPPKRARVRVLEQGNMRALSGQQALDRLGALTAMVQKGACLDLSWSAWEEQA